MKLSTTSPPHQRSFSPFLPLQVICRQSKLYFTTKLLLFVIILLERLYMLLKEKNNNGVMYFLLIIAVLSISLISELVFITYMTRKKIKKTTQRFVFLVHQILTLEALIQLTFPLTDLSDEARNGILRQDILFIMALLARFIDATLLRYGAFLYVLAVFAFHLTVTLQTIYYVSWAAMAGITLLSGFTFLRPQKKRKGQREYIPDKLQREFESYIEGVLMVNRNKQVVYMNGVFKGLLDSINEADALEEVLRLRKFNSYSERARKGFMDELQVDKGNNNARSAFKRQSSLREKNDGQRSQRMRSLKKSFDEKPSGVMFIDSKENGKSTAVKDNNHSYVNILTTEHKEPLTSPITSKTTPTFRKGGFFNKIFGRSSTPKRDSENDSKPHEESVEASLELLFKELDGDDNLDLHCKDWAELKKAWHESLKESKSLDIKDTDTTKAKVIYRTIFGELKIFKIRYLSYLNDHGGVLISLSDITPDFKIQELVEINEQKDKLLRFVSHEFRTPLNCSLALLEMLKSTVSYTLNSLYLEPALNSSKLLLNLVNDILDFSQIRAKKFKIQVQSCNLRKVVEEVLDMMKLQASARNIDLRLEWSNEITKFFHTDANRVKQILLNLISNAFKFTHLGSVTVRARSVDTYTVKFQVIDTGIGISQENLGNLFQEFGKLEDNSNLNPTGIGLGLVISKLLTQELGPDKVGLTVESEEGKGTTFSFLLSSKGNENITRHHLLTKDVELDMSSDEERERPEDLLQKIKHQYGTIEQATRPVVQYEILNTNTQQSMDSISPEEVSMVKQVRFKGFQRQMSAKPYKEPISNFAKFSSLVRSQGTIPIPDHLRDPKRFSAFSQGSHLSKAIPALHARVNKKKPPSVGRSQTSGTSGDMTDNNYRGLDFETLVENLNEICECPKVLIVDDNAFNLTALNMVLKSLGLNSVTAVNGELAIQCVLENQNHHPHCKNFSIILMDVEMPILNGFETTKILRRKMLEGEISFIPIIGVTGHSPHEKRVECLLCGMNDMILKPVTTLILQETILKWVEIPY